jgi:hypothetical protein
MDETAIDEMMSSFRLENCRARTPLVALLRDDIARRQRDDAHAPAVEVAR